MAVDPGATPVGVRALAPDIARGAMLLLIALANVHYYGYGHPIGPRGYTTGLSPLDQVVAFIQTLLVDGRAYPLFGLLFGYGIVQLATRRRDLGMPVGDVVRLVRRRGRWMMVIGVVHGTLLWPGDIVGAYGLIGVLLGGLLVRGSDRALLVTGLIGLSLVTLLYAWSAAPAPEMTSLLPSMEIAEPVLALIVRFVEWIAIGLIAQAIGVFGAVAIGAWAARRRMLDEPERHEALLRRLAVAGLGAGVLGGLPMALLTAEIWAAPSPTIAALAAALHAASGYAGGFGYAALFGLFAAKVIDSGRENRFVRALQACGQRSLSCYLAQSVVFAALFPAWALGLGRGAQLWQMALAAILTWVAILVLAGWSASRGQRGPAEVLLRRLTYGRPGMIRE